MTISPWLQFYVITNYWHGITKVTINIKQQCYNQSNSSKGNEKIFLFKIGLSGEINKDSFNSNLNALLSFKSIAKLSKLALWQSNNIWPKIANFLGVLTNLPVKGIIPMLRSSHKKLPFEFDHNKLRCRNYI